MTHTLASALLVFGIFAAAALGGSKREVVVAGQNFPDTIAILVDTSGSMSVRERQPYKAAMREVAAVARQMTDSGRIRFYTFDDTLAEEPHGWIVLPDAEKVEAALAWLRDRRLGENTKLVEAMEILLALEDDPLGVIVVTDEEPDGGAVSAAAVIVARNSERKNPAIIGIIGIGPRGEAEDNFGKFVATETGGVYVRIGGVKKP